MPVWNIVYRASTVGIRNVTARTADEAKQSIKQAIDEKLHKMDSSSHAREVTILSIMKTTVNDDIVNEY
ncbi:MAG: hypothetical protein P9X24_10010 [Candidatus Hatepunaea meridiana]|nr:hypothetical protein [Candidatus Hatepunaea meridiana]